MRYRMNRADLNSSTYEGVDWITTGVNANVNVTAYEKELECDCGSESVPDLIIGMCQKERRWVTVL